MISFLIVHFITYLHCLVSNNSIPRWVITICQIAISCSMWQIWKQNTNPPSFIITISTSRVIAHALMAHIGHAKTHTAATWGAARVFCCVQVQGFSGLRWPPNVLPHRPHVILRRITSGGCGRCLEADAGRQNLTTKGHSKTSALPSGGPCGSFLMSGAGHY